MLHAHALKLNSPTLRAVKEGRLGWEVLPLALLPTGGKAKGLWMGGVLTHTPLHWRERVELRVGGAPTRSLPHKREREGVDGRHLYPHCLIHPQPEGEGRGFG